MRAHPEVLGILLTSRCNINCRHCCNDSGTAHTGAVSFESIAHLIDSASEIASIPEIGISGGEPFLFPDLLHRVVAYAGARGYSSSITTNGFWGRSTAMPRHLELLRDEGLRSICISSSIFHREFLPAERLQA